MCLQSSALGSDKIITQQVILILYLTFPLQRTSRHKLFSPEINAGGSSGEDGSSGEKKYQLKNVDYLLGTTTKLTDVIVLGMLTQVSPITQFFPLSLKIYFPRECSSTQIPNKCSFE